MTVNLSPVCNQSSYPNNDGTPLNGGLIYTYIAGSSSSQATTYSDSNGSVPNANPMALDSSGRQPNTIWLTSGTTYHIVITEPDGTTVVKEWDNITGTVSSGGAGVTFPLARSSVADQTDDNIAWGDIGTGDATRLRGTLGDDEFQTIFVHDALNSGDGTYEQVWTTRDNSGSCAGGFMMYVPNLTVDNLIQTGGGGGGVTQIDVGVGLNLPNGGTGEVTVQMNSPVSPMTSTTAAINATPVYFVSTQQYAIANNNTFHGVAYGTCTATGAGSVTFLPRIGNNGNNFDTAIATHTTTAATGTANFKYEFTWTVRNSTSAGTCEVVGELMNGDVVGASNKAVNIFTAALATAIDFTAGNSFGLSCETSGSAVTVHITNAYIEMVR